jgi:hypothetical protein
MIRGQANFSKTDHDEATEDVLFFLRNWLGHTMPSLLGVLERIQRDVFESLGYSAGNYSFYASQVESLFLPNFFATLEEYGLPIQVAVKLRSFGLGGDTLDQVLLSLRRVAADPRLPSVLHPYEAEMLNDVVVGLGLPQGM